MAELETAKKNAEKSEKNSEKKEEQKGEKKDEGKTDNKPGEKTEEKSETNATKEAEQAVEKATALLGIDEVDTSQSQVSWVSPVARALLKSREGDEVQLMTPGGLERLEVIAVRYPAPQTEH